MPSKIALSCSKADASFFCEIFFGGILTQEELYLVFRFCWYVCIVEITDIHKGKVMLLAICKRQRANLPLDSRI